MAFQTLWSAIVIYLYAWETSVQNKFWNGTYITDIMNKYGDENLFFKPPPTTIILYCFHQSW
jgi:hypothetical protein